MSFFESHEIASPVWQKLKKHLETKLLELRSRNDSSMDALKTEKLRGRILQVKALLDLERNQAFPEDITD